MSSSRAGILLISWSLRQISLKAGRLRASASLQFNKKEGGETSQRSALGEGEAEHPKSASAGGLRAPQCPHQQRVMRCSNSTVRLWSIARSMSHDCRCGFDTEAARFANSAGSDCKAKADGR